MVTDAFKMKNAERRAQRREKDRLKREEVKSQNRSNVQELLDNLRSLSALERREFLLQVTLDTGLTFNHIERPERTR